MKLYYNLALDEELVCSVYVGDGEALAQAGVESTVRYHADWFFILTFVPDRDERTVSGG